MSSPQVPDAPGWWWRSYPPNENDPLEDGIPTVEPIWVGSGGLTESGLWYRDCETEAGVDDEPTDDGRWLGPVAPPGSPTAEEHAVVVAERDAARAEVERLRAALEDRVPTLAEANLAHLHATLQARARRP